MSARNRTAQRWLKELLDSPRFKLAMLNFEEDPQFMLAILTEIVLETKTVTVDRMKRIYGKNFRSTKQFVLDLMDNDTDFSGFEGSWKLTPTELKLYTKDPKFKMTQAERFKYLKIIQNSFMHPKHLPKKQESPEE